MNDDERNPAGMYLQGLLENDALLFHQMERLSADYAMVPSCIVSHLPYLMVPGLKKVLDLPSHIVYLTAYFMRYYAVTYRAKRICDFCSSCLFFCSSVMNLWCFLSFLWSQLDQTYYVIDMVCWAGISFYECTAEFRFFWMNSKLVESGACEAPSTYHRYKFSLIPVYNCDHEGLQTAYTGQVPYVKDGLLFYNK